LSLQYCLSAPQAERTNVTSIFRSPLGVLRDCWHFSHFVGHRRLGHQLDWNTGGDHI
jgi:hypothetical protein